MKFLPTDWNWSDYHRNFTPERQARYQELLEGIKEFIGEVLARWALKGHHYECEIPEGVFSTAVLGDNRAYAPIVFIIPKTSKFDWGVVRDISLEITNGAPVSRVELDISKLAT